MGIGASLFVMAACYGQPMNKFAYENPDRDFDGIHYFEDCDDDDPEIGAPSYFYDHDGDGFGDENADTSEARCFPSEDFVDNADDCNDNNADINPSEIELCYDQVDNNCDEIIDLEDENCE